MCHRRPQGLPRMDSLTGAEARAKSENESSEPRHCEEGSGDEISGNRRPRDSKVASQCRIFALFTKRSPSVTGGHPQGLRFGVMAKRCARPWGPGGPLGTIRRWFLRRGGGGQGRPHPPAEGRRFLRVSAHPGRCFRRVPPGPPGHNRTCPGPPVTEGLLRNHQFCCIKKIKVLQ
jgi:hypothetical protein